MEFSSGGKLAAITKSERNAIARIPRNQKSGIKTQWLLVGCAISALFWFKRKLMHCTKILLSFSPYGYSKEKRIFPSSPGPGD
jgi:hypothetical protein